MTLLCGWFEGVDERNVIEAFGLEEVSIGDFVLDRRSEIDGAGADRRNRAADPRRCSAMPPRPRRRVFSSTGWLEHPHYTQPRDLAGGAPSPKGSAVGHNHGEIAQWRQGRMARRGLTSGPPPPICGPRILARKRRLTESEIGLNRTRSAPNIRKPTPARGSSGGSFVIRLLRRPRKTDRNDKQRSDDL